MSGLPYGTRASRRSRRRWLIAIPVVVALAIVVDLVRTHDRIGHARWRLLGVSADARTLTLGREGNLCGDRALEPVVREGARTVRITLPTATRVGPFVGAVDCAAVSSTTRIRMRLAQPLAARTLTQPAGGTASGLDGRPLDEDACARLTSLPSSAPAQAVPWVRQQLGACR